MDITGKRDDGYHLVRMIMQTVSLYDELEIVSNDTGEIHLVSDNPKIPTDETNLCVKAALLMKEKYDIKEGFDINLKKHIPSQAGLAGGSTDGAAVMTAIRDMLRPDIADAELMRESVALGADVPYCIMKGTALSEGIGDILTPLRPAEGLYVLLIKPDIDISTGLAYKNYDNAQNVRHPDIDKMLDCIEKKDFERMASLMGNVLEMASAADFPQIGLLKEELKAEGALGSLMSGSGSTVFGLYDEKAAAEKACRIFREKYPEYEVFLTKTVDKIGIKK